MSSATDIKTPCALRTPDQERAAVIAEALAWVGTPYHHMARVKGAGVDCAMLLAEVYEQAGVVGHIEVESYSMHWHLHRDVERLIMVVEQYAHEVEEGKAGDVVLFQFGRTFSHAGILIGDNTEMVHAVITAGVITDEYRRVDDLSLRKKKFYSAWGN